MNRKQITTCLPETAHTHKSPVCARIMYGMYARVQSVFGFIQRHPSRAFFYFIFIFFSLLIDWFKTTQGPVFQWKAAHRLGR